MTHQRIRPYQHSLNHDGEDFEYELCMAVKVGNRIWLRGQTGLDFDGNFVGEGDVAAQAENAMHCSDVLLREGPGSEASSNGGPNSNGSTAFGNSIADISKASG